MSYLDTLLGFCDRATPGPWHVTHDPLGTHVETGDGKGRIVMKSGADRNDGNGICDAFFIAAFNPMIARELIERVKDAEAKLAEAWDEGVGYMAERCVDEHGVSATYRLADCPYRHAN